MFSNRLASHLERGVVGFPTTLASSVGLIMASPVILTVTSGFGMGGDTFALALENILAFQLCDCCKYGEHRFSRWRGCVDGLFTADKFHLFLGQPFHEIEQVARVSCEPAD